MSFQRSNNGDQASESRKLAELQREERRQIRSKLTNIKMKLNKATDELGRARAFKELSKMRNEPGIKNNFTENLFRDMVDRYNKKIKIRDHCQYCGKKYLARVYSYARHLLVDHGVKLSEFRTI